MTDTDGDRLKQTGAQVKWEKNKNMLRLTDKIEKAVCASLCKASSPTHKQINKLIIYTWKILHYYSKKWPS